MEIVSPKKKFRVLVSDAVDSAGIEILRSVANVDVKTKLTEDQICNIINDYDALVVRSGTQVTERIIESAPRLKIIGRAGVGVDNVDVDVATSRGIFVVNSPQGNTVAAAEMTLGLMFCLARNIAAANESMRKGKWEREKFMGAQLQHKTLGIIGLGQVGSHVAQIAREVGMELICYDPYVNQMKADSHGCRICSLEDLLTEADIVTLHVPLISETRNMMNEERIRRMKKTAMLINCSRGGVVDETALCKALEEGRLAGAALDVFQTEAKLPPDSILLSTPNLLLTPHLGASTREAQVNVAVDVAQQIKATLLGSLPESAVNIPGLRAASLASIRSLIECCEILGRIAMQLLSGPLEQIVVNVEGSFATVEKCEPLLMSAANGVLATHAATRVNFVNVRQIAERHKVKLLLTKDENSPKSAIKVEVRSGLYSVAAVKGTVTEDNEVLLKSVNGIPVYMIVPVAGAVCQAVQKSSSPVSYSPDNYADGKIINGINGELYDQAKQKSSSTTTTTTGTKKQVTLLYSRHDDQPGVLAAISTILGESGINIANCHLGRERKQQQLSGNAAGAAAAAAGAAGVSIVGSALCIFHIDGPCPDDIAEKVKKIGVVRECKILNLK